MIPSPRPASSLVFVALLITGLTARAAVPGDGEEHKPRVIQLVINQNVAEDPIPPNPLGPTRRNFRSKLEQLRELAADPEVAGVQLELRGAPDYAHSLDLLEELRAVKAAGKRIVCYTEVLGQREAAFATVSDHLAVPPSGLIALEGLTAEVMYLKDMLAKVDARVEVLHVGEYKTAYEDLARDSMSAAQRETIEELLDEFYGQMIETIASNRGTSAQVIEGLFEKIIVDPFEALEAGLIDAVAYEDEFDESVERLFGGEIELVEGYKDRTKEDIEKMLESPFALFAILPELLSPKKPAAPREPYVGIVYATGQIVSGKSQVDFQGNVTNMGSETIVEALEEVGDDDNCKAVVLRVNSPGGSALASDMIWRAIERVRDKKPVISSMGRVAASGGYWISMGCDAIVAQPSTLTGSIGVVSMLPDLSQTLKAVGANVEVVGRGPHGDQLALLKHGPTPILKDTLVRWMSDVYEVFIRKVAAGRKMDPERIRELAAGRVWTGRQAEQIGLVDALGGLSDAIDLACVRVGLDPGTTPIAELPAAPNFFDQLEEAMEDMVRIRTPAEELLEGLGYGSLLESLRSAALDSRGLHSGRVQAIMPFLVLLR